jgi:hypothetical protein
MGATVPEAALTPGRYPRYHEVVRTVEERVMANRDARVIAAYEDAKNEAFTQFRRLINQSGLLPGTRDLFAAHSEM